MKKSIDIKGISTTSTYADGDCMSVVNMRKKKGVMKPVSPRKIIHTLSKKYQELFVHNLPTVGENWLGVRETSSTVNTYIYKGIWNSATLYKVGQAVLYQGSYYHAMWDVVGIVPGDNSSWLLIEGNITFSDSTTTQTELKQTFSDSQNVNTFPFMGAWNPLTDYVRGQAVSYNGLYYFADWPEKGIAPGSYQWVEIGGITTLVDSIITTTTITQTFNNNLGLYFISVNNTTETFICNITGNASFTQIGNVINILDSVGLKYAIWYQNKYVLINSDFDGQQTDSVLGPVKVDLRVTGCVGATGKKEVRLYRGATTITYSGAGDDTDQAKQARADTTNGLLHKALAGIRKDGKLSGFFMACTALELYDGSFIFPSNPILMGQAWDANSRYSQTVEDGTHDYLSGKVIFRLMANTDEHNAVIPFVDKPDEGYSFGEIDHNESFLTGSNGALKTDTQNYPVLLGQWQKDYLQPTTINVVASYNNLQFKINQTIDPTYVSLIKSVSVFISPEIDLYKISDTDKSHFVGEAVYRASDVWPPRVENYLPVIKTNKEILDELKNNQKFYKVKEITFDEIVAGGWIDLTEDLKGKLGDNLVMQEELPVDNFTHHTLLPQKQMVYNSKLHAMDYKTILSHGWTLNHLFGINGLGQFPSVYGNVTNRFIWFIETHIKTETGISIVVRKKESSEVNALDLPKLNQILSYPDSRAFKMVIYIYIGSLYSYRQEFKLTASDSQNYAYYLSPDLKPIYLTEYSNGLPALPAPLESQREQIYRNAMKVSAINNPFYFPSTTTFTIGTGFLRNARSNALQMSQGQFGQYDVYVSTSEGIYSLDTGTTVSYNRISPASLEIPISDILCPTPFGVVFVGKRGIYVINGQEVKLISEQLEQKEQNYSINHPAIDFLSFIQTLKNILYDNVQNELILVGSGQYNYVLNVTSGMWYLSTEKIDNDVKNVSPNVLVMDNLTIKDYSQQETSSTSIKLITRPIYFGIDEVKKLQRAILRGLIYSLNTNVDTMFAGLYASNDGVNFTLLRGFKLGADKQDRDYKDLDLGFLTRATYRNYCLIFEGEVNEKSEIGLMDFMVDDDYRNDKMR